MKTGAHLTGVKLFDNAGWTPISLSNERLKGLGTPTPANPHVKGP